MSMFSRCRVLTNKFGCCFISPINREICRRAVTSCILQDGSWRFLGIYHSRWDIVRMNSNTQTRENRSTESFLDINTNIFKSPIADIEGFSGVFLHECVWKNVDKWWNKTAMVCAITGRSYTYGQLRRLSGRLATSLRKNNIRPGDTIAAVLPNVPEYAILVMGASEAGVVLTLINPIYTAAETKKQLDNSETVAVVTVPGKYPVVAESIQGNSAIRLPIIVIEDGTVSLPDSVINFKDLVSDNVDEFEKTGMKTERHPDVDTVVLPYSSGTIGLPKGVDLTHKNLVANILQMHKDGFLTSVEPFGDDQDILPVFLPIFHIYGLGIILAGYLSQGSKLICMPQFSSNALLEVLEKNRVSILYTAPPVVQLLANEKRFNKRHVESLKMMISGAAPLGEKVIMKFLDRAGPHVTFTQGYGLTETSPAISSSLHCPDAPVESAGVVIPNSQIRIVGYTDDNVGKNLGRNEVGEIYVRGPQVMKGYYKNPKATEDCMEGEWFKTGDLGSFDDYGHLYIRGRLKELIKVQGFQVAPAELEDVIQGHKKVADAAVIGVAHERYGEVPKAFVVPKPETKIDEQEIKDHVAEHVAKYKQLGHVVFVDKIPKSAAGKILRKELQKF